MTQGGPDFLEVVVDAGLGNSSYLVDLGDGRALAVDASRDARRRGGPFIHHDRGLDHRTTGAGL
ncbi:MAG: hypothetical protein ACRDQ7_12740 [Haloechinothrix sp.]